MKTLKSRHDILFKATAIVIGFGLLAAFFIPQYLKILYFSHWLMILVSVVLIISGKSGFKLKNQSEPTPRYRLIPWIARIIGLQLGLFITFIAVSQIPIQQTVIVTLNANSWLNHIKQLLFTFGYLPQAALAILAAAFVHVIYQQRQPAQISNLLQPLITTQDNDALALIINTSARVASIVTIALTFAVITLLLAITITPESITFRGGFYAGTIMLIIVLVALNYSKAFKALLKHLITSIKNWLVITIVLIVLLTALLTFGHYVFSAFDQFQIPTPNLMTRFSQQHSQSFWLIFMAGWWLGWLPASAIYLAKISSGHSIRLIVVVTMTCGILITTMLYALMHITMVFISAHEWLVALLGLIGFFGLLWQFQQQQMLPCLIELQLQKNNQYKHRNPTRYLIKLFQIAIIFIYLYLPGGITVASIGLFIFTLPFTLILIAIALSKVIKVN